MTTVAFTPDASQPDAPAALRGEWTGLTSGDVGAKTRRPRFSDKTAHGEGNYTGGGSVTLRGSCKADPDETVAADWFNLTDNLGNPLTFTANDGASVQESPLWISPIISGTVVSVNLHLSLGTR